MLRVFERRDFSRIAGDDGATVFLERNLAASPGS
jgi:hypothetical protein